MADKDDYICIPLKELKKKANVNYEKTSVCISMKEILKLMDYDSTQRLLHEIEKKYSLKK